MERNDSKQSKKGLFGNLFLLIALVLVAATAVTYAWFSIGDNARLSSMHMNVTAGPSLRMDLVPHSSFEEYKQTLTFEEITAFVLAETGTDISTSPMEPVTTRDGRTFFFEDGSQAFGRNGTFIEFTLHFMSHEDMYVHLTSTSSKDAEDGTRFWSDANPRLAQTMRLSLTMDENTFFYNPTTTNIEGLTDGNLLFFIPDATNIPVMVRIWIEGTDPACTNELKGTDFAVRLRFEGADENHEALR